MGRIPLRRFRCRRIFSDKRLCHPDQPEKYFDRSIPGEAVLSHLSRLLVLSADKHRHVLHLLVVLVDTVVRQDQHLVPGKEYPAHPQRVWFAFAGFRELVTGGGAQVLCDLCAGKPGRKKCSSSHAAVDWIHGLVLRRCFLLDPWDEFSIAGFICGIGHEVHLVHVSWLPVLLRPLSRAQRQGRAWLWGHRLCPVRDDQFVL